MRFLFLFLGYIAGVLGIALGIFIYSAILGGLKSFGVPYLSPYFPSENKDTEDTIFLRPIWRREHRSSFLHTKKPIQEGPISMLWKEPKNL